MNSQDQASIDPQAAAAHIKAAEARAGQATGAVAAADPLPVRHVGVIGAGTMGGGIAMNFLSAGIPVTLVEVRQEALDRGIGLMRRNYEASAAKGKVTAADVETRMGLLTGSVDMNSLADCDLVIEAVFEQLDIKLAVFGQLDRITRPDAILASNTSYLDVDAIAAATSRPQQVLGLHFFSPANVMRLLEIVRARATSDRVLATAVSLARTIGKVGVVVGNGFGFVGNRILAARQREAESLILEGAAPWDVDRVLQGFGFRMGPFAMRDLVGLDVGWDRAKTSSSTVREILNEMGRHGQKSGGGFYDYDASRTRTPSPITEKIILDFSAGHGIERRTVSDEEIRERTLFAMVNEAAAILDEGIAARPSDIDVVWITGYGWPAALGGPLYWADRVGLPQILDRLKALQAAHGEAFAPAPLLQRLVAEGRDFNSLNEEGASL